ncbi:MAG: PQQ-dependent sugar dehydrogenase [Gemmatimonadota bacterium]
MRALIILCLLSGCAGACESERASGPPTQADSVLALTPVVSGLSFPVFLTAPPGDTTRLFVVEKAGAIRIVKNGAVLPTPFLDITALTTKSSEQGLLGLAFPPDYAISGRFYVSYTAPGGGSAGHSVIARYQVSADPDIANTTDTVIITTNQPYDNHNGGMIAFGPDSMLYFGLGDGGSGGDPDGHGQDRTELLGSILRIDVSGATYTIPSDNPWTADGSIRHELWNYGLRNPWRFSFDRQTGDLYIGDVGQNTREEVDVQPAVSTGSENYGWNTMEGMICFGRAGCTQTGLILPVLDYDHGQGCSITGGYVYRGSAVPAVQGRYFYSDYCSGFLRSFRWSGGSITELRSYPALTQNGHVTSFGEDGRGELYLVTANGEIFRFAAP